MALAHRFQSHTFICSWCSNTVQCHSNPILYMLVNYTASSGQVIPVHICMVIIFSRAWAVVVLCLCDHQQPPLETAIAKHIHSALEFISWPNYYAKWNRNSLCPVLRVYVPSVYMRASVCTNGWASTTNITNCHLHRQYRKTGWCCCCYSYWYCCNSVPIVAAKNQNAKTGVYQPEKKGLLPTEIINNHLGRFSVESMPTLKGNRSVSRS